MVATAKSIQNEMDLIEEPATGQLTPPPSPCTSTSWPVARWLGGQPGHAHPSPSPRDQRVMSRLRETRQSVEPDARSRPAASMKLLHCEGDAR